MKYFFEEQNPARAMGRFFAELGIPLAGQDENPVSPEELLGNRYNPELEPFTLMENSWFLGLVDENLIGGSKTLDRDFLETAPQDYNGIAVFGTSLKQRENNLPPTRTHLASITRAFARSFPNLPVVLLFRYGDCICLANAERLPWKQHSRPGEKVGKVSLLRDIHITDTHAGHKKILERLQRKQGFASFDDLYGHWQSVFDISLLNKEFYEELSSWYFWARSLARKSPLEKKAVVYFPSDGIDQNEQEQENWAATSLIRLITRVIFVWFLREKGLVPPGIFKKEELPSWLVDVSDQSSSYYRAILQNLFFATLNRKMGERKFANESGEFHQHRNEYGVKTLYRYANLLKCNPKNLVKLFANIPWLNGGLFECLDHNNETGKVVYRDGFSRNPGKQARVPNFLFFQDEKTLNLDSTTTGVPASTKVRGLIDILSSYVFTVTENTPVEEDVALDPELLGRAFENLLASYNPETRTNARNRTGSFYTPREIVDYMVNESLREYLLAKLEKSQTPETPQKPDNPQVPTPQTPPAPTPQNPPSPSPTQNRQEQIDKLFSQEHTENPFNPAETSTLIEAISHCRVMDPACGSGAFPMGILQNMVFLLRKLDPDNQNWKQTQIKQAREESGKVYTGNQEKNQRGDRLREINETFDNNTLYPDYTRKLYLIENCIYGCDIQPIAIQICRLRFFISLIVDQEKQPEKENLGIRGLPNLETRFIAADALVKMNLPEEQKRELFKDEELEAKEKELLEVRHRHFNASNRDSKLRLQKKDHRLRDDIIKIVNNRQEAQRQYLQREIATLKEKESHGSLDSRDTKKLATLEEKMGNPHSDGSGKEGLAEQLARWKPYKPDSVSLFFDSYWMFGLNSGFDIVLGNPPYVQLQKEGGRLARKYRNEAFHTFTSSGDIYGLFYEKGVDLLSPGGVLAFITSNKWMKAGYGRNLRKYFIDSGHILTLIDFGEATIFQNAAICTNIMLYRKGSRSPARQVYNLSDQKLDVRQPISRILAQNNPAALRPTERNFIILSKPEARIMDLMRERGTPLGEWENLNIYRGITTGYNEAFIIDTETRNQLVAEDPNSRDILKPPSAGPGCGTLQRGMGREVAG